MISRSVLLLYNKIQYNTIKYNTIQYNTIQYKNRKEEKNNKKIIKTKTTKKLKN